MLNYGTVVAAQVQLLSFCASFYSVIYKPFDAMCYIVWYNMCSASGKMQAVECKRLNGKLWNGQYMSPLDISGPSTANELKFAIKSILDLFKSAHLIGQLDMCNYLICTFDQGWLDNFQVFRQIFF